MRVKYTLQATINVTELFNSLYIVITKEVIVAFPQWKTLSTIVRSTPPCGRWRGANPQRMEMVPRDLVFFSFFIPTR